MAWYQSVAAKIGKKKKGSGAKHGSGDGRIQEMH